MTTKHPRSEAAARTELLTERAREVGPATRPAPGPWPPAPSSWAFLLRPLVSRGPRGRPIAAPTATLTDLGAAWKPASARSRGPAPKELYVAAPGGRPGSSERAF